MGELLPPAPTGTREESILDFPDLIELSYDGVYPNEIPFYRAIVERAVEEAEGRTPGAAPRVLELGAGFGRVALPLALAGWRVTALDRHPAMLAELIRRAAAAGVDIACVKADMRDFDLTAAAPFDAVLCPLGIANMLWSATSALSHWRSVARALRPGGRALHVVSAATQGPRIMPHHATWERRRGDLRGRTDFEFRPLTVPTSEAVFPDDLAEFDHRLSVFDGARWRLLRWQGRMRVYTPPFLDHLSGCIPELEFVGWHRMFELGDLLAAPRDEDAVAIVVARRR